MINCSEIMLNIIWKEDQTWIFIEEQLIDCQVLKKGTCRPDHNANQSNLVVQWYFIILSWVAFKYRRTKTIVTSYDGVYILSYQVYKRKRVALHKPLRTGYYLSCELCYQLASLRFQTTWYMPSFVTGVTYRRCSVGNIYVSLLQS